MNYRYRKKPVVIEAFQMTRERRRDNRDWPNWLNEAWQSGIVSPLLLTGTPTYEIDPELLMIQTREGVHNVTWDDFIIRGVKGELYPCKPDIFAATYEIAEDPERWLMEIDGKIQHKMKVRP